MWAPRSFLKDTRYEDQQLVEVWMQRVWWLSGTMKGVSLLPRHCQCWSEPQTKSTQSAMESKVEEKQILYINIYMWNLEKCSRWT